jgi:hypothetical protein
MAIRKILLKVAGGRKVSFEEMMWRRDRVGVLRVEESGSESVGAPLTKDEARQLATALMTWAVSP